MFCAMHNHDDLIGGSEAALMLGVHRSTLGRWTQAGRISPVIQLPGRNGVVLYRRSDIEALGAEVTAGT
jgi:predicted site-specific integrase-resolvase